MTHVFYIVYYFFVFILDFLVAITQQMINFFDILSLPHLKIAFNIFSVPAVPFSSPFPPIKSKLQNICIGFCMLVTSFYI